jgi:hypothetical protein
VTLSAFRYFSSAPDAPKVSNAEWLLAPFGALKAHESLTQNSLSFSLFVGF